MVAQPIGRGGSIGMLRGRPPRPPSCERYIAFGDHSMVVELVAGNVKRKTARCGDIAVHNSSARPRIGAQVAKQRDGCCTNRYVVGEQIFHGQVGETCAGNVLFLIEPGEFTAVTACNTQSSVGEDPFIVGEVAEDLLDAPPSLAIREIATQIAKRLEERDRGSLLAEKNLARIVSNDQLDIRMSVVRILARDGATRRHWMALRCVVQIDCPAPDVGRSAAGGVTLPTPRVGATAVRQPFDVVDRDSTDPFLRWEDPGRFVVGLPQVCRIKPLDAPTSVSASSGPEPVRDLYRPRQRCSNPLLETMIPCCRKARSCQ
jgi:hypothetical protein